MKRPILLSKVDRDARMKRSVWRRDRFRCRYCGVKLLEPPRGTPVLGDEYATVDHVVPKSKGGRNTFANLVTACLPCNRDKGDKLIAPAELAAKRRLMTGASQ